MSWSDADFPALTPKSEPVTFRAANALITDRKGRLLMQLRDNDPRIACPGHWGFFGGEVEPGEDLQTGILRELHEELEIALKPQVIAPFVSTTSLSRPNGHLYVFACRQYIEPAEIRLREGAGFGYFEPDQITELSIMPTLKPVIHHYLRELGQT